MVFENRALARQGALSAIRRLGKDSNWGTTVDESGAGVVDLFLSPPRMTKWTRQEESAMPWMAQSRVPDLPSGVIDSWASSCSQRGLHHRQRRRH